MGSVNFLTDVTKTVNIDKNVVLDVDKNVFSSVVLNGNLATAEGSADAIGSGTGGGTGSLIRETLTIDSFDDTQIVEPNVVEGVNPDVEGPLLLTSTDLVGVSRTLFAEVLSVEGAADLGVNNPQTGKLDFSASNNAFVNAYALYEAAAPFDPFPGFDNDDIIEDLLNAESLADVCFTYTFEDIDFEPGTGADGSPATVRVSLVLGDGSGNIAITTVAFVPGTDGGGFSDLSITGIVAGLIDEDLDVAPGTVVASAPNGASIVALGTEDDVDNNGLPVNFNEVDFFEILLEDDPTDPIGVNGFSSAEFFALDSVIDENPSIDGTDASLGDFTFDRCIIVEDEFGLLAEVDTFAQVQPGGAFAFSESLAALDMGA